jgi:tRNA(Ile)-lysidine synthase
MSTLAAVLDAMRHSALPPSGSRVLAMLSGGADSVCLVHALRELLGHEAIVALHVNHGLRDAADSDERFCAGLCDELGVPYRSTRVEVPREGNLEANARALRYGAAEEARAGEGLDLIATGHTATDQLETVVYRLASSPGRRALLGIAPRRGRVVRPLLAVSADETRAYCREAGLRWREDETNLDPAFARNRIRHEVVPVLRSINAAADKNAAATVDELRDEAELIEAQVDEAAAMLSSGGRAPALDGRRLGEIARPLRRLLLRRLAEQAAGAPLPLGAAVVDEIERLASAAGSASLDVGGGVRVTSEYGILRFGRLEPERAEQCPSVLEVPGRCTFGDWHLACELDEGDRVGGREALGSVDEPLLDADKLASRLVVRAWEEGDRMRPLGLGGSKALQDLLTDRKVPRALRRRLPVVVSDGEIAWVAGVAVGEPFKVSDRTVRRVRLRASASEPSACRPAD